MDPKVIGNNLLLVVGYIAALTIVIAFLTIPLRHKTRWVKWSHQNGNLDTILRSISLLIGVPVLSYGGLMMSSLQFEGIAAGLLLVGIGLVLTGAGLLQLDVANPVPDLTTDTFQPDQLTYTIVERRPPKRRKK